MPSLLDFLTPPPPAAGLVRGMTDLGSLLNRFRERLLSNAAPGAAAVQAAQEHDAKNASGYEKFVNRELAHLPAPHIPGAEEFTRVTGKPHPAQPLAQWAADVFNQQTSPAALASLLPFGFGKNKGAKGFNEKAAGSEVTPPSRTYNEGSVKPSNVWIRQSADKNNSDRTLLVQWSNDLINPPGSGPKSRADAYYDKLYQSRAGYDRPADFWEIPQWQANLAHNLPNADVYVIRNPQEAVAFANKAGYKNVAFSALDVNKEMVRDFASKYNGKVVVGGYGDLETAFKDLPNVTVHPTVKSFIESEGMKYEPGYDYRHYSGTKTIPRLTMSEGCKHQCAFCTIPKKVTEHSKAEIMQQADAFARDLPSSLIYVNDKTFGQAKNHTLLPEVYNRIKASNPDFQGFVIQTTAAQMKKMDPTFLKDAGIKYAELGIESYNDPVLRKANKPATEAIIDSAADKLRSAGVTMIPNIMVGLPGETPATYQRTLNWLRDNSDNISHANIYNLAVYDEAPLSKTLKATTEADRNENVIAKSWMEDPAAHTNFNDEVMDWASGQLEKTPHPRKADFQTIGGDAGIPPEMRQGPQLNDLLNPPKPAPVVASPAYKSILDVKLLGKKVEPEDLKYGFILPDGTAIYSGQTASHGPVFAAAMGRKNAVGWQKDASQEGVIRLSPTGMGPGAEIFGHPTDEQLMTLRRIEKAQNLPVQFDLTDPFFSDRPGSNPIIGTGSGVNQIRRTIEEKKYNPTPKPSKKTSELFNPMEPIPLSDLLQGVTLNA